MSSYFSEEALFTNEKATFYHSKLLTASLHMDDCIVCKAVLKTGEEDVVVIHKTDGIIANHGRTANLEVLGCWLDMVRLANA